VKEQLACKFEFHPHFEKSPHPELWVNGGWPVVPITGDVRSGNHSGRIQDPDKFFVEARILASDQTGSEGDAQQWQARFSC
jgi:hypothetical protein